MAVTVKTNDQSTNFPSYITLDDLEDTVVADILTGTTGSVYSIIIENENGTSGTEAYVHLYDNLIPTVGAGGSAQEMKLRNRNSAAVARVTHCFIRYGHAFSVGCSAAASKASNASDAPDFTTNVIILGD